MTGKKSPKQERRRKWADDFVRSRDCMPDEVYASTMKIAIEIVAMLGRLDMAGFSNRSEAAMILATDEKSRSSARILWGIAKGLRSAKRAAEIGVIDDAGSEVRVELPDEDGTPGSVKVAD